MLAVEDYLSRLQKLLTNVYEQLMRQAEANKQQADKVQRKSNIGPGDNILLSTKHLKLKDKPGKLQP